MTHVETFEKYIAADKMASKSRLITTWLIESLEAQEKRGNLKMIDQVNLKMGRDFLEILDIYLETGEVK